MVFFHLIIQLCLLFPPDLLTSADTLATSLSLLGNHMFSYPVERDDGATSDQQEPPDSYLSHVTVHDERPDEEPDSNHRESPQTEDMDNSDCHSNDSRTADGGTKEDVVDIDQSDSGEFVVTMLAKAKLEEQGIGVKGRSSPLLEVGTEETPAFMSHRDEDVTADSWREHRKHVFVLSEAGKPIYSRYGSEEALSSTMGVMMALVSFVQSGDNIIRSVYSGKSIMSFTPPRPLSLTIKST